eukprot:TRINITY_DN2788_c0_g1_i1.p1 TRINITY_DN2788_c0_g1~~TRINITY_DN2788_c0_g1_i1.p1  ORF type:complete len:175 (-),score=63.75 TRINITY_DN2788_c0_g1_i1:53-577(-)
MDELALVLKEIEEIEASIAPAIIKNVKAFFGTQSKASNTQPVQKEEVKVEQEKKIEEDKKDVKTETLPEITKPKETLLKSVTMRFKSMMWDEPKSEQTTSEMISDDHKSSETSKDQTTTKEDVKTTEMPVKIEKPAENAKMEVVEDHIETDNQKESNSVDKPVVDQPKKKFFLF